MVFMHFRCEWLKISSLFEEKERIIDTNISWKIIIMYQKIMDTFLMLFTSRKNFKNIPIFKKKKLLIKDFINCTRMIL